MRLARHLGVVLLLAAGHVSCAAMQRTWRFQAVGVGTALVEPHVQSAKVTRNRVTLALTLLNKTKSPARLSVNSSRLSLPDGTSIEGNSDAIERGEALGHKLMQHFGWSEGDGAVPPGHSQPVELVFRHSRRDLRRVPWMTVDLSQVLINGQVTGLPALVLTAPPDAPMGEDI